MTDIVERLRTEGRVYTHMEAAAEIEWLRGERNRLAADLAKAHKDAVAWMEKVHQPAAEIARLREALALGIHMREAQTTYFKTRSKDALVAAKALEAEFLHRARALLEGER